jgi:hypothetical protein
MFYGMGSDDEVETSRSPQVAARERVTGCENTLIGHAREFWAHVCVVVPEGPTQFKRGRWKWQRSRDGPDHAFDVGGWSPARLLWG